MAKDASGTLRKVAPQTRPAADFAFSQLNTAVPMILSAAGFNGGSANACVLLGELVQRFLALLARTSAESAQAANRTEPTPWDVEMSLEHVMGLGALAELQEWADEEGVWKRYLSQLIPEPVLKQRARLAECTYCRLPRCVARRKEERIGAALPAYFRRDACGARSAPRDRRGRRGCVGLGRDAPAHRRCRGRSAPC